MEAVIYRPAQTAMQSGRARMSKWVLEFIPAEARRADPLMGWIGCGDTRAQLRLCFDSLEQAVTHAEREGISYQVRQPNERRVRPKKYADSFRYRKVG